MTDFLIKRFIRDNENINSVQVREKYGVLSSFVGMACNILLFAVKFILGTATKSIAITADAFNNLSDVGSCVVTFIGFKMASQPADEDHPFGHGRIEYISGMIITFFILMVGVEILKSSAEKILHPSSVHFSALTVAILVLSILVKLWMATFNTKLGDKIHSQTMKAAAADSLSDCISTGATTLGILISLFVPIEVDGYLGILVGAFILYNGYGIAKDTVSPLLGKSPDPDLVKEIETTILSCDIIDGIHDLVIHDYGPGRVMGSAHAEISADLPVMEAHDAIDNVERQIEEKLHMPFVIHFDPVEKDNSEVIYLKSKLTDIVKEIDADMSIHDLRIVPGPTHTNIIFDVVVPYHYKEKNTLLKKSIDTEVKKLNESYFTVINFDRSYL